MELLTERLSLLPLTLDLLTLYVNDTGYLEQSLGLTITNNPPGEPLQSIIRDIMINNVKNHLDQYLWYTVWLIILKEENRIIGSLAFKGLIHGEVEIGYGTDPQYQNKGYMTEAVQNVVNWALTQPEVLMVTAETLRTNLASQRVLEKVGMTKFNLSDDYYYWKISKNYKISYSEF